MTGEPYASPMVRGHHASLMEPHDGHMIRDSDD